MSDVILAFNHGASLENDYISFENGLNTALEPIFVDADLSIEEYDVDLENDIVIRRNLPIPDEYGDTTGDTAVSSDILSGVIAHSFDTDTEKAIKLIGSMPNNVAVNKILDSSSNNQEYLIPEGYHDGRGTVRISLQNRTVTPSKEIQHITPSNGKVLSEIIVDAMPIGTAATPETVITANPVISIDANGNIVSSVNANLSITPTITEGYISQGIEGTVTASGNNSLQMNIYPSRTLYPSLNDQIVESERYLIGNQTIKAVQHIGINAANVKNGVPVKIGDSDNAERIISVTGTFTSSETVSSGQNAADRSKILSGYSAWVDGLEILGNMNNNGTIAGTINGLTETVYNIPSGYTNGGSVSITSDIEQALASI